jgi:hypothetical protein
MLVLDAEGDRLKEKRRREMLTCCRQLEQLDLSSKPSKKSKTTKLQRETKVVTATCVIGQMAHEGGA